MTKTHFNFGIGNFAGLLLVIFLSLIGYQGMAQPLLVENFDYPNGALLTANGWTAHSGAGSQPIDVTNGLSFTGYAGSGIGGAANLDNTGEDDNKSFTSQTEGVIYAAFIVQTQSSNSVGYFFHLSSDPLNTSAMISRVWVNATGDGLAIGSSTPSASAYTSITPGTPTLVVVKYDIATKISSLFVFSSFPSSEPGTPNATFTETASPINIGTVALRQYNSSQRMIVDGIRVAKTWADAVAPGSASTPSIAATPSSLTGFTYVVDNGPSVSQSYSLSATNLTPASGNITVTPSANYEISLNNTTFTQAATPIAYTAGALDATTIYVRLKAGLAGGAYNGELIVNSGGGATDVNVSCSGNVEAPATTALPYTEDFETGLGLCYTYSVSGPSKYWQHSSSGKYAYMNGYNTGVLEEDWLVLPAIDLNTNTNAKMTFDSWYNFGGDDADNYMKLMYSSDYAGIGDPTSATWTELPFTMPSASSTWTASGLVDLAGITGENVYIAFKYHYNSGSYRSWQVDNFSIVEILEPVLSLSPDALSGFTYVVGEGPSTPKTYAVSAANLVGTGNIVITAPENYEISRYGTSFLLPSINLAYADGVITGQPVTIYVRLKAGLAGGTYETNIPHTDVNIGEVLLPVSGEVTTINQVANIAELRNGATDGTLYTLTGEALLSFQTTTRHQKFIQDATGAILIDDAAGIITTTYNIGDGITGLTGRLTVYNNMLEFIPTEDPGPASSTGHTIVPEEVTLSNLNTSYQAKLVKVNMAEFGVTGNFTSSTNYTITDPTGTGVFRTQYSTLDYIGTPIPTAIQNITGVVMQYNTTSQLIARSLTDFEEATIVDPLISVSPSTLNGLNYSDGNGPSAEQSFVIDGQNLTGNISIAAPADYEISLVSGAGFVATNPVVLTPASGIVAETTIYVRLKAGLAVGTYNNEEVVASSAGATDATVTLSGTVFDPAAGGGMETFANLDLTGSSYVDGTFLGQDGSTWTYFQARGDVEITGKALMIGRNRTPQSNVYSGIINGGVGTISFDYMQAFSTNVNLNVLVNDVVVGNVTTNGEANVIKNSGDITVDISGPVTIKFISANNSDGQVVIDNITWTGSAGGATAVVAPTFNPPAGNYLNPVNVTISTTTEGATLYYSMVSATGPWTAYTTPVNIATETTLWAYGTKDGLTDSPVSSAVYTFSTAVPVANIAALRQGATDGTVYQLTGEAILTFQSSTRHQKFIQDASAAIMIDDPTGKITTTYNLYDGITGITGTLTLYNGLLEFIPTANPGAPTSTGNTVTPVAVTLSNLDASYQAKLVVVNMADFAVTGNFAASTNYNITDPSGAGVFRTQYADVNYIGTPIPQETQNITGVVTQYNTTMQLVARSLSDFESASTTDPSITLTPAVLNGFTYEVGNGPSAEQSFSVSGQNLTAGISIAASANYEISTGTGGSFVATNPVVLAQTGGNVAATTIYVRLKAGLAAGSYNGEQLVATSTGAANKVVTLNGSVTTPGSGGLLLVDNFEYAIGSNLVDNGWVAHSGAGNESPTVTDGLTFNGYAGTDIGGAALLDNTGEDVHRTFGEQTSGTVYAAFIVNPTGNGAAGYFIHFGQSTIGTTYFTRIWTNATADGLGIGQSEPTTYVPITAGQPTLGVMKFDFATMTSSLFVFNSFPAAEPATADAVFTETASFANIGSIALRQFNASQNIIVDGIRVATTWEDAVAASGGAPVVASPTFNPPAGNYLNPINVTISSSTAGATLYYSETSATGPWTVYTTPVNVAAATTIWAYGEKDGFDNSPVTSASYTFNQATPVATIAELRQGSTDGTVYQLTGEAILTFQSATRHQKYIQDATAAVLIDDPSGIITTTYNLYDGITGITGTLTLYNNMLEFVPTVNPGAATSTGNTLDPVEVTLNNLDDSYQAKLVKILLVDFVNDGTFAVSTNYNITDPDGTGVFRTQYADLDYIGTAIPTELQDITGVILQYQSTMQLVARGLSDFSNSATTDPVINTNPASLSGFTYVEGNGPSASQSYALSAANLVGTGNISVTAPENFEISTDDSSFGTTLSFAFADGVITGQPVTVYVRLKAGLAIGMYEGETITHSGGGAPDKLVTLNGQVTGELVPAITAEIVPQFIEGINGTNSNRVPFAYRATISNIQPNTTYRYINQIVVGTDDPTTNGAGNVIFVNQDGNFYRTSSPNLGTDGGYGTFTTDENGSYSGWFCNEPTGNARFTPGNQVFMRIRLNDGMDGTTAALWLTTATSATVLQFGTEADPTMGTAIRGISNDTPKDFVFLYDNVAGTGRPLCATHIETCGVDFIEPGSYAAFYSGIVAEVDGSWGGIVPNVNANGVQRIETRDLNDGSLTGNYDMASGIWMTTDTRNPNGGIDNVLVIDLTSIGIDEPETATLSIYSAGQQIRVITSDASTQTFVLYNLQGQAIYNRQLSGSNSYSLNLNVPVGIYVARVSGASASTSQKLIIR